MVNGKKLKYNERDDDFDASTADAKANLKAGAGKSRNSDAVRQAGARKKIKLDINPTDAAQRAAAIEAESKRLVDHAVAHKVWSLLSVRGRTEAK